MNGMHCLKEYQYATIRKIHKPRSLTPDHFAVGSMMHGGKARWYTKKFKTDEQTWQSVQQAMLEECERDKLPVTLKARQMAERYMKEYITHWSKRPLPTPIATEYKLGPTPLEPGDPSFWWRTARLDDVSRYPNGLNKLWLGETKTTSEPIPQLVSKYELHPQILLQMVLWKMDPKGEALFGPIAGVMLDVIQKGYGTTKSKFDRVCIPVPGFAMTWFPRTLKVYLKILAGVDWDADVPRNPTSCVRPAGRAMIACEFKELCINGRNAANLYVMGEGKSLLSHRPEPGKVSHPWL